MCCVCIRVVWMMTPSPVQSWNWQGEERSPVLNIKPVACFLSGVKVPVNRSWQIICLLKHETGSHHLTQDLMSNFTNVNECRNVVFFWALLWAVFGCLLHPEMHLQRVNAVPAVSCACYLQPFVLLSLSHLLNLDGK